MAERQFRSLWVILAAVMLLLSVSLTETAFAAVVSVSRAEVSGNRLRIEGNASANRAITVDGVSMTTSSSSGSFRIDRSGYTRPADCTVDLHDGTPAAPRVVRLSGCVVTTPPPPPPPPPPPTSVALVTVTLNPATLQGGQTASATVVLTAPAPAGGAVVSFLSKNAAATVPSTLIVPAGVNSRVVPVFVTTNPVTATTTGPIEATYNGVTLTTVVTVTPPPPPQPGGQLESISLSPSLVQTGTLQSSATLFFTALTGTGGAFVTLTSSNTSVATVPASVTVPAFSSQGAFGVAIRSSALGTTTISATYNGVTRSAVLTAQSATLFRIITESPLPQATVGANYAGFIEACCGQGGPYTWSLVSGTVPDGLRFAGNDLGLTRTTGVTGVPTRVQTTTFTVRARDGAGNTATKTFTLSVGPADPLVITNQSGTLPPGRVGVNYEAAVFPGGGVPPWTWSHVAGTLPPGLRLQASPGRVLGTPSAPGTFSFTLRVDDSGGQFATGVFSITVSP
ncbi:putative Ig domain-containing protein [Knoellia sp. S7-12]|uniref:putative Ig domain-containing protein n=1 Tax=Knoellia sp. S7-12 TaxID=3126698 RepID=UPI003367DFD4